MLESTVGLFNLDSNIKKLSDSQRETLAQRFKWKLSWLDLGLALQSVEHPVKSSWWSQTLHFSFEISTCSCAQFQKNSGRRSDNSFIHCAISSY